MLFAAIIAQYLHFSYELLKIDCVFHMKKDVTPCRVNVFQCRPDGRIFCSGEQTDGGFQLYSPGSVTTKNYPLLLKIRCLKGNEKIAYKVESSSRGGLAMEIQMQFGRRVQQLRHEQGLSQEKFALLINMDRTYFASVYQILHPMPEIRLFHMCRKSNDCV